MIPDDIAGPLGSVPATYKPSVFYFRRELRESRSCERAAVVAVIVSAEFEQLRVWSVAQGLLPRSDAAAPIFEMLRTAIRQSTSHGQAILLGLFLCHELEQLKAQVRAAGLIPPKWIVSPEESEEKGWSDGHAITG